MRVPRVSAIMSRPVFTLQPGHGIGLADGVMRMQGIRHLPVVDPEGRLVGLVTHRDLAQTLAYQLARPVDLENPVALTIPVKRIMRREVWTVEPSTPAPQAAKMMHDHKIGCLPVVEDRRVVGIVTAQDFLGLLAGMFARGVGPEAYGVRVG